MIDTCEATCLRKPSLDEDTILDIEGTLFALRRSRAHRKGANKREMWITGMKKSARAQPIPGACRHALHIVNSFKCKCLTSDQRTNALYRTVSMAPQLNRTLPSFYW